MDEALLLTLGLAIGIAAAWFVTSARYRASVQAERHVAEARAAEQRRNLEEQRDLLQEDRERLEASFSSLSAAALDRSSEQFLRLASERLQSVVTKADGDLGQRQQAIQGLVQPLQESLTKMEQQVLGLEQRRAQAYGDLQRHLGELGKAQAALQRETGTLSSALRNPQARGRWGEITLRRTVELSGMVENCDFEEQVSLGGESRGRPDMVVRLPGGRNVAVDAKCPLDAYLAAMGAPTEEERSQHLQRHAQQVRQHVRQLAEKDYAAQLGSTPECVVLFIPGEPFLGAALEAQPALFEESFDKGIVLATPSTLIALLRSAALGWRQEKLAENAEEIRQVGQELHERLGKLTGHLGKLGQNLERSVESFNAVVGSYEARVLPGARRFEELGAAGREPIPEVAAITVAPRSVQAAVNAESD